MSEQNPILLYQQQKGSKPVIEDIIPKIITDKSKQKIALDFVVWLRQNKIQLAWGNLKNSWAWKANYKGKTIIGITMKSDSWVDYDNKFWYIIPYFNLKKHTEALMNEKLKNFIQDNQSYCVHGVNRRRKGNCNPKRVCAGGISKTIFGKDFAGLCCGGNLNSTDKIGVTFFDPDDVMIDWVKKLVELEKKTREEAIQKNKK